MFEPFNNTNKEGCLKDINSFIEQIPNFEKEVLFDQDKDLLTNEKDIGLVDTINSYFTEMKNRITKKNILSNLSNEESFQVMNGLESYILEQLYPKIFPKIPNPEDIFLQKKCSRLFFIKPSNIVKDKKFLNISEKSLEISVQYIKEMDNQKSPIDILNSLGKANGFLLNNMQFNSAKNDFSFFLSNKEFYHCKLSSLINFFSHFVNKTFL